MEDARWTMPLSYGTERVRHPYYGPAGIRASRGGDATGPLPHVLDCCTDSTGAGGPARLLHVGWLYCVKAA